MKKKSTILCIFIIFALLIIVILRYKEKSKSELYTKYQYPNEAFFGKELYSEIDYSCSDYEAEVGKTVVERAVEISKYIEIKYVIN